MNLNDFNTTISTAFYTVDEAIVVAALQSCNITSIDFIGLAPIHKDPAQAKADAQEDLEEVIYEAGGHLSTENIDILAKGEDIPKRQYDKLSAEEKIAAAAVKKHCRIANGDFNKQRVSVIFPRAFYEAIATELSIPRDGKKRSLGNGLSAALERHILPMAESQTSEKIGYLNFIVEDEGDVRKVFANATAEAEATDDDVEGMMDQVIASN